MNLMILNLGPGGDLATLLEIKKKVSEDVARIYAAEIVLALEALHQNDIIFRDLKPENIVIDEDGHVLLTDFGLSKMGVDKNVKMQSFCGSPAYLAPEMLMKKGFIDTYYDLLGHNRQVDWYSLGILIYELLVGVTPYFDTEKEILYDNIRRGSIRLPKTLSIDVKDLILKVVIHLLIVCSSLLGTPARGLAQRRMARK